MLKSAMILAAGRGERMGELTANCPKVLLPLYGEPLLGHHLKAFAKAGIENVVINLAHLGNQIREFAGDGSKYGLQVRYSQEDGIGLETGGGVQQALSLLGDAPFIVINGDIWTDYPLQQLMNGAGSGHLILVPNPEFHPKGDYALRDGVVQNEGDCFCFSGLSVFTPQLFAGFAPGRFPLREVFAPAIAAAELTGELYQGRWFNFNTPEALAQAQSLGGKNSV